jgi:hypothetical protein
LGLATVIIPSGERNSEKGRERGIGVVFSAYQDETFNGETDDERLVVRLEKARRRFDRAAPCVKYRFVVVSRETIPEDLATPSD